MRHGKGYKLHHILAGPMLIVAIAGLLVNILVLWIVTVVRPIMLMSKVLFTCDG